MWRLFGTVHLDNLMLNKLYSLGGMKGKTKYPITPSVSPSTNPDFILFWDKMILTKQHLDNFNLELDN